MTTPLGFLLALCFALVVFILPRRFAALGIFAGVCYVTEGLPLGVVVFHFSVIRFVLLAGFLRALARGEMSKLRFNPVDRALVYFAVGSMIIATLRGGTFEEFVYQIGVLYNELLSYLVFRALLRDARDVTDLLASVAYLIIPFALLLIAEAISHRNFFSMFGGVTEIDMIRDGHVRSQGAFRSPITAGAFGAILGILFVTMIFSGTHRRAAVVGLIFSILAVISSHSSGPLLGFGLGLLALLCWPIRRHTRIVRWGLVLTLVGLQFFMKAPVWFLLGRVSDVVGGGGYHRAYLIDQFVRHFGDWWLAGTDKTDDWMPTQLVFGGSDLTNKFVSDGVNAGLIGLILSILLLVRCFQRVGAGIKLSRGIDPSMEKFCWGLGATLITNIGIFFSVSYFDQMYVVWSFSLAAIAAVEVRKCASRQPSSVDGLRSPSYGGERVSGGENTLPSLNPSSCPSL
jgi:hypothetical protein